MIILASIMETEIHFLESLLFWNWRKLLFI